MKEIIAFIMKWAKKVDPIALAEVAAALVKLKYAKKPEDRRKAFIDLATALAKLFGK